MAMNLTLPLPPSANRYWRTTVRAGFPHTYVSPEAKQYKALAYWTAKKQGAEPLDGEVIVRGTVYFPNRRGDLDNRTKILLDALEGVAYHDDKQVWGIQWSRETDKTNPRVELEIVRRVP